MNVEGSRRIVARGRGGTLIVSCGRPLTEEEFYKMSDRLQYAMRSRAKVIVLDGNIKVEGVISARPSPKWRGSGYRPRWAR